MNKQIKETIENHKLVAIMLRDEIARSMESKSKFAETLITDLERSGI